MAKKFPTAEVIAGVIYSNLAGKRTACSIAELCMKALLLQENEDLVRDVLVKMCQDGIAVQVGCNFMLKENLFSSKVKQQWLPNTLSPVKASMCGEEFPPLSLTREIVPVKRRSSQIEGNRQMTPKNRDKEVMQYELSQQPACEPKEEPLLDAAIATGAQTQIHHHNYSIVHNHYYTQNGNHCKINIHLSQDSLRKN